MFSVCCFIFDILDVLFHSSRSPPALPLSSPDGMVSASEPIHLPYPYKMTSYVFPVSYIDPCFLLSSPRFNFLSLCFSTPHILSTTIIISISLSLHLVLLAPIKPCSLHIILC